MMPVSDNVPSRSVPIMVWWIMGINVAVFVFELFLNERALTELIYSLGIVPLRYHQHLIGREPVLSLSSYLPFLMSMFLHGGWLHIIMNMWMLWIFGDNVEDRMGSGRFLAFYLICGVLSGAAQVFVSPTSAVPTIGASGAIAGVLGAYFVMFPRAKLIVIVPLLFIPIFFELPAVVYLFVWFLLQFFNSTLSLVNPRDVGGIAWWVHLGGFTAGMMLCRLFVRREKRQQPTPAE